jgi:hypothetical protein
MSSEIIPIPLTVNGASGRIIDTRQSKRLWQSDGRELISAHLVDVKFESIHALTNLVDLAVARAAECGFPGVFLAMPAASKFPEVIPKDLLKTQVTLTGAAIYGVGIPPGEWIVNTSEI